VVRFDVTAVTVRLVEVKGLSSHGVLPMMSVVVDSAEFQDGQKPDPGMRSLPL
jgi:hypothetical protein